VFVKLLEDLKPHIDVNRLGMAIVKDAAEKKET